MNTSKVRRITNFEFCMKLTGSPEVVGTPSDSQTDSDIEITEVKSTNGHKRRWGTGTKVTWSSDEGWDVPEDITKKKASKRAKTADTKKKLTARAKKIVASRKKAKAAGEPKKKERIWGDDSDDSVFDEDIPEYLKERRREFDKGHQTLEDAGLRLPPSYNDIEFSDDERLVDLEERPKFSRATEPSRKYEDIEMPHSLGIIPASIAQYLRDYQVDGVAFLHECFVYQKGGILGDDMGLGKTVQVAAFLTAAFGKTGDERDWKRMRKMRRAQGQPWYPRVLIVCPGSLMENWNNELTRWGWWHIEKFHGNDKEDALKTIKSGRAEVLITTYRTYTNYKSELNLIQWDCIVADECHQIKEKSSAVTKAMNEVNALCRIGLTGTAIQNKYEELWTLLNWTNPGRLGPISTWKSSISDPLRLGQS
jgi:SNF2 family DNA or RNA helicase